MRPRPGPVVLVVSVAGLLILAVLSLRGPGEGPARQLVEDYLEAKVAYGCEHYAYYSEAYARAEDVDVEQCLEDEAFAEGEYFEYEVQDVRVDGVRAEVDVEDKSDAPRGPFTVFLVVEDGDWRIGDIEYSE